MWQEIEITTQNRVEWPDITERVGAIVKQSGVREGMCRIYIPHTTAGITINENADPDVVRDILAGLKRLVPQNGDYAHAEGNSDAHLKASLMGFSCLVPICSGRLALGTWQGIYFCEFDGPRRRHILIDCS
ncbi:MAG TPA: secondary thiamine-phosphate synthase enzyme YjbQ [Bacillota bacterium]